MRGACSTRHGVVDLESGDALEVDDIIRRIVLTGPFELDPGSRRQLDAHGDDDAGPVRKRPCAP